MAATKTNTTAIHRGRAKKVTEFNEEATQKVRPSPRRPPRS